MTAFFDYPTGSAFGRVLPKNKIYEHAKASSKLKNLFVRQVDKIVWKYKLATETINIPAKKSVPEIQIFSITLKTGELHEDVLRSIDKAIPKGEGPVYLEWIIWRAFLAIDSLTNPPWEARRFQIDQDFLPVHCAPGRGPDMIFEFEDSIIVVEVTLTASSRQSMRSFCRANEREQSHSRNPGHVQRFIEQLISKYPQQIIHHLASPGNRDAV